MKLTKITKDKLIKIFKIELKDKFLSDEGLNIIITKWQRNSRPLTESENYIFQELDKLFRGKHYVSY